MQCLVKGLTDLFLMVTVDQRLCLDTWMVANDKATVIAFPLIDKQSFLTTEQNLGNLISKLSFKGVSLLSVLMTITFVFIDKCNILKII